VPQGGILVLGRVGPASSRPGGSTPSLPGMDWLRNRWARCSDRALDETPSTRQNAAPIWRNDPAGRVVSADDCGTVWQRRFLPAWLVLSHARQFPLVPGYWRMPPTGFERPPIITQSHTSMLGAPHHKKRCAKVGALLPIRGVLGNRGALSCRRTLRTCPFARGICQGCDGREAGRQPISCSPTEVARRDPVHFEVWAWTSAI
jgi:hypothetical protein